MPEEVRSIGAYRLCGLLGRGAMGQVYRAERLQSGRLVALKTVKLPWAAVLPLIRREIHALERLRHPGFVRILDSGAEAGVPWYAMELIEGPALRQWAAKLDLARPEHLMSLLSVVRRLCSALAYVPGEGIVHRDLKPENILILDGRRETGVSSESGLAPVPTPIDGIGRNPSGIRGPSPFSRLSSPVSICLAGARGLRVRGAVRGRAVAPDARGGGHSGRHAAVHGAGAAPRRASGRQGRSVLAGLHALRAALREAAVRGAGAAGARGAACPGAAAAAGAGAVGAAGAGGPCAEALAEAAAPRAGLRHGRGGGARQARGARRTGGARAAGVSVSAGLRGPRAGAR